MELSKIIDSQVSSGLTPKIYRTNINEIEPNDDKQKSELYEINVFDHILQIAPGLTIKDKEYKDLTYCYIYVILKNKVKAKLGIVEELTDSPPVIFDISLIEDGRLRLFDVYEQNPELIKELEYVQVSREKEAEPTYTGPGYEEMDENVFDYIIKEELKNQTSEKTITGYENLSKQTKDSIKQSQYPEEQKIIVEILGMYKKPIVDAKKNMSETAINILKNGVKNISQLCASLLLLSISLKTFNFIILDETDEVVKLNNYRAFTTFPLVETLPYFIVKWENNMPHLIEKYNSFSLLPDKYKDKKKTTSTKPKSAAAEESKMPTSTKPKLAAAEESKMPTSAKPKSAAAEESKKPIQSVKIQEKSSDLKTERKKKTPIQEEELFSENEDEMPISKKTDKTESKKLPMQEEELFSDSDNNEPPKKSQIQKIKSPNIGLKLKQTATQSAQTTQSRRGKTIRNDNNE